MSLRIVELSSENVKRLRAVHIKPEGSVVQITGKNGQGKSSVLDSISYLLGGKEAICEQPIRKGEKKAKIVATIGDLVVTRTFTEGGGGSLTVASAEGAKYPSPQAMLDKLVGRLTLDPLAFSRLDPKKQAETLKQLVGLDFTELDAKREKVFADRTEINRKLKEVTAKLPSLQHHPDVPPSKVSISELIAERDRRQEANRQIAARQARQDELVEAIADNKRKADDNAEVGTQQQKLAANDVKVIEQERAEEIARINRQYDIKVENAKRLRVEISERAWSDREGHLVTAKALQDELDALPEAPAAEDVDEITQLINDADDINRKIEENQKWSEAVSEESEIRRKSKALTRLLEEIDETKTKQLEAAKFPIAGLSFDDSGVTFNGLPFNQSSSAEQLRASVAIGLALNPKLRVLLIRDGSLLDSEGLQLLTQLAEEHDAQIWIERVEDAGDVGVVIVDGEVAGNE